jgi:sulfite exporter TauE/SafE
MLSTETLYFIFFSSGFSVGFGHCLGMCGPIVASLSLSSKGRGEGVLLAHLLYNVGRVTTYAVLGGIMGVTGSFTRVTASIASLQKGVMLFAGLLVVLLGLAMAGWIPLGRFFGDYHNPGGLLARGFSKLSAARTKAAYYPLGLLLGFLPCGPLYTSLVSAARAGMEAASPLEGFFLGTGLMLSFGLGTVPSLLAVAKLVDLGWLKRRELIYKVSSILMIILGIYFVIKAIRY